SFQVILQPDLANPGLRKHSLIVLYKLAKSSKVYPQCYVLKDIKRGTPEDGGGFCDIYKGRHNDQYVCLKVIRLYQKPDTDAMLKVVSKETILWRRLRHPNILPFYGIYYLDESRRQICLVSPWMDNGNLVVYLKKNPLVPRKPFICDIVHGLEYLHREDIIHGDLKGANILVNASGGACIADFGLSSVRTDKTFPYTSATTAAPGCTYRWLAPELLETSSRRTRASDVWAFGLVCYEVFTRELPYRECSNDYQVIMKVHAGDLQARPEGDAVPEWDRVDDEAWSLMNRCWTREPENRPTFIQILQGLQAEAYSGKREGILDCTPLESQYGFQKAMQKNSDIRTDLTRVEQILNEVCGPASMLNLFSPRATQYSSDTITLVHKARYFISKALLRS
ncbi:kinase-like protein, partial [Macrolepiota fuliginosa MF-IS2]